MESKAEGHEWNILLKITITDWKYTAKKFGTCFLTNSICENALLPEKTLKTNILSCFMISVLMFGT